MKSTCFYFKLVHQSKNNARKKEQALDINREMRSETKSSLLLSHQITRPAAKASRASTDESQSSGLFYWEETWEKWHRDASRVSLFILVFSGYR